MAFLTAVALKTNLHDDSREARFYLCILAEPKWKFFQSQNPLLVTARDDRGRAYSLGSEALSQEYWNSSRSNLMDFDNDWAAVKLSRLSPRATTLKVLSIEVPVRIIHTTRQCRFEDVKPDSQATKTIDGRTFKLKKFEIDGGTVRACLSITGTEAWSTNSFEYTVEKGGKKIGTMSMRTASGKQSSVELRLEGRVRGRIKPGESCDFVVQFPGKTTVRKYRFDFKDLKLPYPVKRVKL